MTPLQKAKTLVNPADWHKIPAQLTAIEWNVFLTGCAMAHIDKVLPIVTLITEVVKTTGVQPYEVLKLIFIDRITPPEEKPGITALYVEDSETPLAVYDADGNLIDRDK